MDEYRRLPKRDVWHFHPRCQWWTRTFTQDDGRVRVEEERPITGELCNECLAKQKKDRN